MVICSLFSVLLYNFLTSQKDPILLIKAPQIQSEGYTYTILSNLDPEQISFLSSFSCFFFWHRALSFLQNNHFHGLNNRRGLRFLFGLSLKPSVKETCNNLYPCIATLHGRSSPRLKHPLWRVFWYSCSCWESASNSYYELEN